MLISLCNEALVPMSFAEQCAFARAVGYDGIEIAPFTLGEEPWRLPASERARIRQIAADAGIRITGSHALLWGLNDASITTADDGRRRKTIDILKGLIALTADLGGDVMVHGSPMARLVEDGDSGKRGLESFAAIARDAEAANIAYCIEPLTKKEDVFIKTIAEALDVAAAIGSPAMCSMIDCAAAAAGETQSVPDLIRRHVPGGRIAHIHFNDPNRRGPGEGDLAFAPIMAALGEVQYSRNAAVEPFIFEPDGRTCTARQIGYLRGVMELAAEGRAAG